MEQIYLETSKILKAISAPKRLRIVDMLSCGEMGATEIIKNRKGVMLENGSKYLEAVKFIKTAILKSQYQAARNVNSEQLSLYYVIGAYVSTNSRKGTWGTGAIKEIGTRLQAGLPGIRRFFDANIKLMQQFYDEESPLLVGSTAVDQTVKNNRINLRLFF